MKQTINKSEFMDAFNAIRPDNFSYDGLCALFEYIEQYEQDSGTEIELDVIALCCEYNEDLIANVLESYNLEVEDKTDVDQCIEAIAAETPVIWHDNDSVLYLAW